MRLLHTKHFRIETPENVPPYAILSHRWLKKASEEVSFQDLQHRQAPENEGPSNAEHTFHPDISGKEGFSKFEGACNRAFQDGLEYIWIDTCCIDKTSSAELSEAINSMYAWYRDSSVCYVYLHDVNHDIDRDDLISTLRRAEWFKRGWTLQELLAPDNVYFFANDWSRIGSKAIWASALHEVTRIRKEILLGIPCKPSIAERMSWAVGRETHKIEDRAYSLLGMFDIHMPIIYGEGDKAFKRLQLEIMKSSDDQTIFAWRNSRKYPDSSREQGLLASAPEAFSWDHGVSYPPVHMHHSSAFHFPDRSRLSLEDGYALQNDGIHITLPMKQDGKSWLAVLRYRTEDQELSYGIYLHEIPGSNSFLRTAPTKLLQLGQSDLKGVALKKICMVIDHIPPPTSPRRKFFTLRSPNLNLDDCCCYICPGDHGGHRDRQVLPPDTQIELKSNTQRCCIYFQNEGAILLIGMEDHRPWIHLLTNLDLCRIIDPLRQPTFYAPQLTSEPSQLTFEPSQLTSEPSQFTSEPSHNDIDLISPSRFSAPPVQTMLASPRRTDNRNLQLHARSTSPPSRLLHALRNSCNVCAIIRQQARGGVDIKSGGADFLTETTFMGEQIEVNVRKGRVATNEVEYIVTITAN